MYIYIVSFTVVHMSTYTHAHACTRAKKLHSCMLVYSVCSLNKFSHDLVITPCACIHAHLMCRLKCIFIIKD